MKPMLVYVIYMHHDGAVYIDNRPDRGQFPSWTDEKNDATLFRTKEFAQEVCDAIKKRTGHSCSPMNKQCGEGVQIAPAAHDYPNMLLSFLGMDVASRPSYFHTHVMGEFRRRTNRRKLVGRRSADKVGHVSDAMKGPPIVGMKSSFNVIDEIFDDVGVNAKRAVRKNELKRGGIETHKAHHRRLEKIVLKQDDIIATHRPNEAVKELAVDKAMLMRRVNQLKGQVEDQEVQLDKWQGVAQQIADLHSSLTNF